ncbi:mitochondrial proton/calcium exchanger protein-like isoform X2 [Saccostrea cucullata]|uniref:mitochondrial proton/calcium exchanger protein-like isoform X1 n=2 Tax=Saccostrea cuccullata TaxID=36930 RepID=UPI002ED5D52F
MPYRYLICTPAKTFSNELMRKLVPLGCCHTSQARPCGSRSHKRHYYTSHKLNSKLTHKPHWHLPSENKRLIQNCDNYKTNFIIRRVTYRNSQGNDVPYVRDYHISALLFKDENKKEVKDVKGHGATESKDSPKESGAKGGKSPTDASSKVPKENAKEVGPPAKKSLGTRIMNELKHYYHGFKLLFKEFRMSTRYMIDVVIFRKSLKRREIQQVIRSTFDIFRILPMIVMIVIPFMEFAIPFVIKFFPGLLPSTFQPKKTDDMRMKVLKAKIEMTKNMVETIKNHPLISKKSETAEDFANFVANVRNKGIQPTTEEIMKFSKFFEDELTLENLNRQQLQAMCRILDLPPMGMDSFLRFSLRMKLKRLKLDDKMIQQEGVDSLTIPELQAANRERGMRALGVSEARLKSQLQQWLDLHLEKNIPSSLLLFSRALYLPETLSTEEQLKESIINLPETMTSKEKIAEAQALKEKEKAEKEKAEKERIPEVVPEKVVEVPEVPPAPPTPEEVPIPVEEPATGVKGLAAKLQSKLADFKQKVDEYDKEATKKRVLKIWKLIRELGEENRREHKKFFEEYKEYLKEGEKPEKVVAESGKKAKVPKPTEEEKKAIATAEAIAAESLMTAETQTDPAMMMEAQPGEELKDLDEEITTEDLEDLEDAIIEAAKEKSVDLEKEEREEELEDCEEDVDELKAVVLQEGDVDSKNASKLWKMVNRAVDKLDKQIDEFHDQKDEIQVEIDTREVRLKKSPELQTNLEKREEILSELKKRKKSVISINEMLLALKRIKKIPDDVRTQKILQVLDEDRDGRIELVHALKVIELLGKDNMKLNPKQVSEVTRLVKKELLQEEKETLKDNAKTLKTEELQSKNDNSSKEKDESDKKQEKQS